MRKGIKKQFWLSEKDAADLKRKAQKCGITETAMIRQLLRGYEPREKPDERFYEAMKEMYAIGSNLNQLTASDFCLDHLTHLLSRNEKSRSLILEENLQRPAM